MNEPGLTAARRIAFVIPTHVLTDPKPDPRVAVLSRGEEIHSPVHPASDEPEAIRASAARAGPGVLATAVASREWDVGGEG